VVYDVKTQPGMGWRLPTQRLLDVTDQRAPAIQIASLHRRIAAGLGPLVGIQSVAFPATRPNP
jgi:hypothetical protein